VLFATIVAYKDAMAPDAGGDKRGRPLLDYDPTACGDRLLTLYSDHSIIVNQNSFNKVVDSDPALCYNNDIKQHHSGTVGSD
jgi:hypothetical protein